MQQRNLASTQLVVVHDKIHVAVSSLCPLCVLCVLRDPK